MDATKAIVIVNWNTTRLFLMILPDLLCAKIPFNDTAGMKDDKTAATREDVAVSHSTYFGVVFGSYFFAS